MNTFTATEKALAKMTNTNLRGPGCTLVNLRSRAAQVDTGLITFSEATAALSKNAFYYSNGAIAKI